MGNKDLVRLAQENHDLKKVVRKQKKELLEARKLAMAYGSERQARNISEKYGIPLLKGHVKIALIDK